MQNQSLKAKIFLSAIIFCSFFGWAESVWAVPPGYTLKWEDNFNRTSLNTGSTKVWDNRSRLGVRGDAINVMNAVSLAEGKLVITTYTSNGTHYSGIVETDTAFAKTFGYWEASIDFDGAPGTWMAFWLQSPEIGIVDDPLNPAKRGVEIDIVEHRVVDGSGSDISNKANHALHWGGYESYHERKHSLTEAPGLASGFHTYGVEWTDTNYKFYIDGILKWTATDTIVPISKRPEYIIFSNEVMGGSWAGNIPLGGYGDLATSQTKMRVDYVRWYERSGDSISPSAPSGLSVN